MTDNLLSTINYSDNKTIQLIRNTIAPTATADEFGLFIEYCRSTGLNPFKKEIWFIKTPGYRKKDGTMTAPRVQIMTGINGYMTIANRNPEFDGMTCEILMDESKRIIGATATVYRKDRKYPSVATALMDEYYKPNPYGNKGVWEQMPSIMISKCAKSLALREAFPQELGGTYTDAEMPTTHAAPKVVEVQSLAGSQVSKDKLEDVTFTDDDLPWGTDLKKK